MILFNGVGVINLLNLDKTKCMHFSKSKNISPPILKIGDKELKYVNQFKYLGVTIDRNLRHYSHMNAIVVFLKQQQGILSRICTFLNYKGSLLYYYAYIHSKLTYAIGAWGGALLASSNQSRRVKRIQDRILRMLFGCYFSPDADLYKCTGILRIDDVYRHKIVVTLYRIMFDSKIEFLYGNIQNLLFRHRYPTRNKRLMVHVIHSEIVRFNFIYRSIIEFNKLPSRLYEDTSASKFSRSVKQYFRS